MEKEKTRTKAVQKAEEEKGILIQNLENKINGYEKQRAAYEQEYNELQKGGSRFNLIRKVQRGKKLREATGNYEKRIVHEAELLRIKGDDDGYESAMRKIDEKVRQYKNDLAKNKTSQPEVASAKKETEVDKKEPTELEKIVKKVFDEDKKETVSVDKNVPVALKNSYLNMRTFVDTSKRDYDVLKTDRLNLETFLRAKLNIEKDQNFEKAVSDYIANQFTENIQRTFEIEKIPNLLRNLPSLTFNDFIKLIKKREIS